MAVALLSACPDAAASCPANYGHVTHSSTIGIIDVQCAINCSLWELSGGGAAQMPVCLGGDPSGADVNCDSACTISDVMLEIALVLGMPLSSDVDANGNQCADACEQPDCGDGWCSPTESCLTCTSDCGACAANCCSPSYVPGCGDSTCESCVCMRDAFCCSVTWDVVCSRSALLACSSACQCAGTGPCCTPHAAPDCAEAACESCVCAADPFCCDGTWDSLCVQQARSSGCSAECACPPEPEGACCRPRPVPGCGDATCEGCVCQTDSLCCDAAWDASCAVLASDGCQAACGCAPVAVSSCCKPHGSPGCALPACEACVFALDSWCKDVLWDESCVGLAASVCVQSCKCQ